MPRMRLLERDHRVFESKWPDADAFLTAASLRDECYTIARVERSRRQPWAVARLAELLQAPACREPWFVDLLRADTQGNIEKELDLAGRL